MNIIELDAASHNGIDDMRSLIEQVQVPPSHGRYRVFIIDEVHMLSTAAFNAFLKTLEEPPSHAIFVLATTEKHKIIPTILSRCQIYDFSRITIQDMVNHLMNVAQHEGIQAEPAALGVIARKADGAMRDALSIFDQVAAASMGQVTYQSTIDNLNILDSVYYGRLVEAFLSGNVPSALVIYKEIRDKGFDSQFFINGLGLYMRDLMLAMHPSTLNLLETDDQEKQSMAQMARKCHPQFIYRAMDICNDADLNFRTATNKQFLIELALVKLCQLCSPSPDKSGSGEGQLKPIAATPAASATPTTAPSAAPAAQPARQQAPTPVAQQPMPQQPAPTPAATPRPQPQMPAMSNPAPSIRTATPRITKPGIPSMHTISIKGDAKDKAAPAAGSPAATSEAKRNQPYTPEAVEKAWLDFAEAHPTERILVNTMLAARPRLLDNGAFFVAVDDQIQVDAINESKHDILTHIRTAVSNDLFDFKVSVTQGQSSPVTWTQREVLQHIVNEHPEISDFIKEFGFTLG